MLSPRRLILTALALTTGSAMAIGLPSAAGASPAPAAAPAYVIAFKAIVLPPTTTTGSEFHSTSCAIGPLTNPIVVTCEETGTIKFTAAGGSGTANLSSVLADINWKFTLVRATPVGSAYRMVGTGTESVGTSPVVRPVKVTGTLSVEPTALPTISGTETVHPIPIPVG